MNKKHTYTDEVAPKKGFHVTRDASKIVWTTGRDHYVDIPRGFKEKHVMKLWCEQNCQYPVVYYNDSVELQSSAVKNFDYADMEARMFFFDEEDAVAFKLRWL